MPTLFTHPALPLAIGLGLGSRIIPPRLLAAGVVCSLLPDVDVAGYLYGIPYGASAGHRGLTHSFAFAAGVALLGALLFRWRGDAAGKAWLFLFVAAVSHGLLDAITNGGLGTAFLWPFSEQRFIVPLAYQVIPAAPLSPTGFIGPRGVAVLLAELQWVWLPGLILAVLIGALRRPGPVE
jgi:inner membrane protein